MCAAALAAGLLAAPAYAEDVHDVKGSDVKGSDAQGLRGVGWALKETGKDSRFRGLAAVSRSTAWVAGSKGTVLRTVDGGRSWRDVSPPGAVAEGLELRDIEAFDARRAVALSIGEGRRHGCCAPRTAAPPGPRPSATPTRAPSTTASPSSTPGTGWP